MSPCEAKTNLIIGLIAEARVSNDRGWLAWLIILNYKRMSGKHVSLVAPNPMPKVAITDLISGETTGNITAAIT